MQLWENHLKIILNSRDFPAIKHSKSFYENLMLFNTRYNKKFPHFVCHRYIAREFNFILELFNMSYCASFAQPALSMMNITIPITIPTIVARHIPVSWTSPI